MKKRKNILLVLIALLLSFTSIHANDHFSQGASSQDDETETFDKIDTDAHTDEVLGTVEVTYLSQSPIELLKTEVLTGPIGEPYQAEIMNIPGYKYLGWDYNDFGAEPEGIFKENKQNVFLTYEKSNYDELIVYIEMFDADNEKELRPKEVSYSVMGTESSGESNLLFEDAFLTADYDADYFVGYTKVMNDVPKYNDKNEEISYSIVLPEFDHYQIDQTVVKNENNTVEIFVCYTLTPQFINIHIEKQFGVDLTSEVRGVRTREDTSIIPEEIKVHILNDNEDVEGSPLILNEENYWKGSIVDLPNVDSDGNIINYTIVEEQVEGFKPEVTVLYDDLNPQENLRTLEYLITNHYVKDATVEKIWVGGPENKPDVQFQLYGEWNKVTTYSLYKVVEKIGDPITLKDGETSFTWKDLPRYDYTDKYYPQEITYYVEEITNLEGYESKYSDDRLTITNTFTGEGINETIEGHKIWKDNNNELGKRPHSIELELYADDKFLESLTVSDESNWEYKFSTQPKYLKGQEIIYTIKEVPVEFYETEVIGYDVVNTIIAKTEPEIPVEPEKPTKPDITVDPEIPKEELTPTQPEIETNNKTESIKEIPETSVNGWGYQEYMTVILSIGLLIALIQVKRKIYKQR